MLISQAFENYIKYHSRQCSSNKTIKNYKEIIHKFIDFIGDLSIDSLSVELFYTYQEHLIHRNLSKNSIATYLRHLRAFISYMERMGYIPFESISKYIIIPSKTNRMVKLLNKIDISNVFDSIYYRLEWLKYRNCLIVALMFDSGLRQSEVVNIKNSDFLLDDNLLIVHGKGGKTRIVPFGITTLKYYNLYTSNLPYSGDFLLYNVRGNHISCNTIKQFINKLKNKTGIKDLSSHKLRHNFATNYCIDCYQQNGYVDIYKLSYILGHEDIETTKIYLHIANEYIAGSNFISHLDLIF